MAALVAHAWPIAWSVIVALAIAAVAVAARHRPQSCEDPGAGWPLDILLDSMTRPEHDTEWTTS